MESLFEKVKKDLRNGLKEGVAALKEGATVMSGKVNELKEEGKRQFKIFEMKAKIQGQMTELGGMVYDVIDNKKCVPTESKIKAEFAKIKKLEGQLRKLEGSKKVKAASPGKPKAKVTSKKTSKTAAKKTTTKK